MTVSSGGLEFEIRRRRKRNNNSISVCPKMPQLMNTTLLCKVHPCHLWNCIVPANSPSTVCSYSPYHPTSNGAKPSQLMCNMSHCLDKKIIIFMKQAKPSQPMWYGAIVQSHRLAPSLKEANCQWIQNLWTVSNITMKQWVQYFILPFLKWESKPVFVSKGHPVPAHGILIICRNYQTEEISWSGYAP